MRQRSPMSGDKRPRVSNHITLSFSVTPVTLRELVWSESVTLDTG
jgi:hypothetical protein